MVLAVDMLHYCCTMHNDTHSVHNRLLKPWWGRPPCFQPFSRLLFSPVQTQLTPIVRCWGPGPPFPKSGVPTPRVRAHPFPRARNNSVNVNSCSISRSIVNINTQFMLHINHSVIAPPVLILPSTVFIVAHRSCIVSSVSSATCLLLPL
jgi:hypothetical protein